MNREETLALWQEGRDAWNAWAQEMLDRRAEMEQDGTWAASRGARGEEKPESDATDVWMRAAVADFEGQVFTEEANFSNFLFPGSARFNNASFERDAVFDSVTFRGTAVFGSATFGGEALFKHATFSETAWFERSRFGGDAGFEGATFIETAWFERSTFSETVWFGSATFGGTAWFVNAMFGGTAWFEGARFRGSAQFMSTTFSVAAVFINATFSGHVALQNATFCAYAAFESVTFSEDAGFNSVTFSGDARFGSARFNGDAQFSSATFSRDALFYRTTFSGAARFYSTTFSRNTRFIRATFHRDAEFGQATFKGLANFVEASFQGFADFEAVQGDRAFTLARASFYEVPNFIQAHFSEAPRLDEVSIPEVGGIARFLVPLLQGIDPASGLSARYRALKRLAIEAHDHTRELDYFANELKASRGDPDSPLPCPLNFVRKDEQGKRLPIWPGGLHFLFGLSYEALSNFGRSMGLPLIWWAVATAAFFWAYLAQAVAGDQCAAGGSDSTPWSAALGLSIRKALPFAGIASSEKLNQIYACLYGIHGQTGRLAELPDRFTPVIPDAVDYIGMGQLVLSILLLFLFLLAVRSHFRIR